MPPGGPNNKFAFAIVSAATDEAEKLAMASNIAAAAPESPCSSNPPSEMEGDPFASGFPLEKQNDGSSAGNVDDTRDVDFSPSLYGRLPRLARSISMPGSKHLGHLQQVNWGTSPPSSFSAFDELSNELADSVQAVIQTLLHISPPHLLAPVKEQFSSCAVQLPSPSVSSLFTTMKNLNYMSANLHFFASDNEYSASNPDAQPGRAQDNFDIGEVLQSVGDVLSGIASRSSVDLVLYHGDVGMKHINVIGDECCIMFILTHIVRQVILVSKPGDSLELGLHLNSVCSTVPAGEEPLEATPGEIVSPDILAEGAPMTCTFDITHKCAPVLDESFLLLRHPPKLDGVFLRRLMARLGTDISFHTRPTTSLVCDSLYSLTIPLTRGPMMAIDSSLPSLSLEDDEANGCLLSLPTSLPLSKEPTLEELAIFSETVLKGKRAVLHASESSTFARHLTSYLTSWGLDVVHVPVEGTAAPVDKEVACSVDKLGYVSFPRVAPTVSPIPDPSTGQPSPKPLEDIPATDSVVSSAHSDSTLPLEPSFILIDDDVDVLRRRLNRYRPDISPVFLLNRPSLPSYHRPRSSPQVNKVFGTGTPGDSTPKSGRQPSAAKYLPEPPSSAVILHITSLRNFKIVKDIVQSALFLVPPSYIPDIIVVPKPAGPRRFLTALHTALCRPSIDPYFHPIATSPQSPGGLSSPPLPSHRMPSTTSLRASAGPSSPNNGRGPVISSQGSPNEWMAPSRSPRERGTGLSSSSDQGQQMSSPLSTDSMEYFPSAAVKIGGGSAASGLMIQSPDGRPAGIFFQPRSNAKGVASLSELPPVPLKRSTPHIDLHSGSIRPSLGFRRHPEVHRPPQIPANKERSTGSLASIPSGSVPTPEGRNKEGAEDNTPTPTTSSFIRSGQSRPSSSHSRPNSAQGPPEIASSLSNRPLVVRRLSVHQPEEDSPIRPIARERRTLFGEPSATPSGAAFQWPKSPSPTVLPLSGVDAQIVDKRAQLLSRSNSVQELIVQGAAENQAMVPAAASEALPSPSLASAQAKKAPKSSRKSSEPKASPISAKSKAQSAITPPISVLIVEDNPINQTILTTWMRRKKLKYATANNGQEAVEKWRTGQFHLILMDIQMPVMDGIEATKEIRRLEKVGASENSMTASDAGRVLSDSPRSVPTTPYHSSVIIVALTASSLQSDRVNALAAGCNDFLTKPVHLHWLDKKIIEWGSIKALQMWANPDQSRAIQERQDARAQALELRIPGTNIRSAPTMPRSKASRSKSGNFRRPRSQNRLSPTPIREPLGLDGRPSEELISGKRAHSIHIIERAKEEEARQNGGVVFGQKALHSPSIASVLQMGPERSFSPEIAVSSDARHRKNTQYMDVPPSPSSPSTVEGQ